MRENGLEPGPKRGEKSWTEFNPLVQEYVAHHHEERAHQGIGNIPLTGQPDAPDDIPTLKMIGCTERLAGALKYFYRKAG